MPNIDDYSSNTVIPTKRNVRKNIDAAFTLVELLLVILIIGLVSGILAYGLGGVNFWREEAFVRRLTETISFLHHQAVADQAFYRLELSFGDSAHPQDHFYRVGVLKPEDEESEEVIDLCSGEAGSLSCELASFLSPSIGESQTLIPPPGYPSLWEPVALPEGARFDDVRTMRGPVPARPGGSAYVLFSPRGFSEFAVIHITLGGGAKRTILVNPFTGIPEIFKSYKDFQWTYGRKDKNKNDSAE